jgi:hypothetical protein
MKKALIGTLIGIFSVIAATFIAVEHYFGAVIAGVFIKVIALIGIIYILKILAKKFWNTFVSDLTHE